MFIPSPQRVSEHGKVVYLKFVSIWVGNLGHLRLLKNILYIFVSTLERDHNTLIFEAFEQILREQLQLQFSGGSDVGNSHFGL